MNRFCCRKTCLEKQYGNYSVGVAKLSKVFFSSRKRNFCCENGSTTGHLVPKFNNNGGLR
jgi:hypothetical protein